MKDTNSETQSLIATFYDKEREKEAEEATYSPITTSLPSTDAAMLQIVANRFGKSIEDLAREALAGALKEMFAVLESSDRKILAKEADDLDAELAKENANNKGIADFATKPAQWVTYDRTLTRQENKLKQQKAKEEKSKETKAVEQTAVPQTSSQETPEETDSALATTIDANETIGAPETEVPHVEASTAESVFSA